MKIFNNMLKNNICGKLIISILILGIMIFLSFLPKYMTTTYSYRDTDDPTEYFYMVQGNRIEQTICFDKSYVERIGVCISNITLGTKGTLQLKLHEKGFEDNVIAESEIDLENVNTRKYIWFDVKKEVDVKKNYQLDVITKDVSGELAMLCRTKDTIVNETIENATEYGVPINTYLAVNFSYRARIDGAVLICMWFMAIIAIVYIWAWGFITATRSRLRKCIVTTIMILIIPFFYNYCVPQQDEIHGLIHTKFYFGITVYYIILLCISFLLYLRKKISFIPFFIAITLLNGIVYSFVFMPVSSPDEATHFYESYRLSNIMLGQESTDEYGYVLVRNCDLYEKKTQITDNYIVSLWEKCTEPVASDDEIIVASDFPYVVSAPLLGYIPQAIGITLARLLHVNYFWLIYFGRFANLIAFTILVALAAWIVPRVRWILFLICSFPFLIQEIASYSYDTMIIAFSILWGAYIYRLMYQDKNISKKQICFLLLIVFCFAQFKPVYFPLIGLVLLIPNKKISDSSVVKAIIFKSIIILVAFGVMISVWYHKSSPLNMRAWQGETIAIETIGDEIEEQQLYDGWVNSQETGIVHFSSGVTETPISYMLHNPLNIFQRIWYTIIDSIDWLVLYIFGNYMGGHEIRIPIAVTIIFIICFFRCIQRERAEIYSLNLLKLKIYVIFLDLISVFGLMLVSYLQWSAMGEKQLIGIQGRYFYPLLITLIYGISKDEKNENDHFMELSMVNIVHILTLLYACRIIWSR